jgi:hypothetical protein
MGFELAVGVVATIISFFIAPRRDRQTLPKKTPESKKTPDLEPLKDFDWQTVQPLQLRPFKPTYHITMGTLLGL